MLAIGPQLEDIAAAIRDETPPDADRIADLAKQAYARETELKEVLRDILPFADAWRRAALANLGAPVTLIEESVRKAQALQADLDSAYRIVEDH